MCPDFLAEQIRFLRTDEHSQLPLKCSTTSVFKKWDVEAVSNLEQRKGKTKCSLWPGWFEQTANLQPVDWIKSFSKHVDTLFLEMSCSKPTNGFVWRQISQTASLFFLLFFSSYFSWTHFFLVIIRLEESEMLIRHMQMSLWWSSTKRLMFAWER